MERNVFYGNFPLVGVEIYEMLNFDLFTAFTKFMLDTRVCVDLCLTSRSNPTRRPVRCCIRSQRIHINWKPQITADGLEMIFSIHVWRNFQHHFLYGNFHTAGRLASSTRAKSRERRETKAINFHIAESGRIYEPIAGKTPDPLNSRHVRSRVREQQCRSHAHPSGGNFFN